MFQNEIQIGREPLKLGVPETSLNPVFTLAPIHLASNQVLFLRLVTDLPIEMQRINRLKAIPPGVVVASLREVLDEAVVVLIEVVVFQFIIGKAPLMADVEGGTTLEFSKIPAIEMKETPRTHRLHWTAQIHSEKTRTRRSSSLNQYNRRSTYNWQLQFNLHQFPNQKYPRNPMWCHPHLLQNLLNRRRSLLQLREWWTWSLS
jgi:hypothetical protein